MVNRSIGIGVGIGVSTGPAGAAGGLPENVLLDSEGSPLIDSNSEYIIAAAA